MERYIWTMSGKKYSESGSIRLSYAVHTWDIDNTIDPNVIIGFDVTFNSALCSECNAAKVEEVIPFLCCYIY